MVKNLWQYHLPLNNELVTATPDWFDFVELENEPTIDKIHWCVYGVPYDGIVYLKVPFIVMMSFVFVDSSQ